MVDQFNKPSQPSDSASLSYRDAGVEDVAVNLGLEDIAEEAITSLGQDYAAVVAAQSRALAKLSHEIVAAIHTASQK